MIEAVAEAYPDLKAQKNYQELMNELSISENKIADIRKFYNKEVTSYKRFVRQFPNKQILSMMGYEIKDYERLEFKNTSVDAPKNLFNK
jgi:LemA protein